MSEVQAEYKTGVSPIEDRRGCCPECGGALLHWKQAQINAVKQALEVLRDAGFDTHLVRMYGSDMPVVITLSAK